MFWCQSLQKMWKQCFLKQNYAQKLFIAFKMTISCCFCLRGNLYFPDFLQNKFYNINYRYPLQALTTWTVNARSWWSIWSTVKDWFKPFLTKLRLNLYFLIGRFRINVTWSKYVLKKKRGRLLMKWEQWLSFLSCLYSTGNNLNMTCHFLDCTFVSIKFHLFLNTILLYLMSKFLACTFTNLTRGKIRSNFLFSLFTCFWALDLTGRWKSRLVFKKL